MQDDLSGVDFTGVDIGAQQEPDLSGVDFTGVDFTEPSNDLDGIDFTGVDLPSDSGFVSNTLKGAGKRAADIGSNLLDFIGNVSKEGERYLAEATGINPYIKFGDDGISFELNANPDETDNVASWAARNVDSAAEGIDYKPQFTWENLKGDVSAENLAGYIVEQGVQSVPDMAAALITLPAYIASRTEEIAEVRAENSGKEVDLSELGKAAIPAVAASLLERVGAKGVVNTGGAIGIKGASKEVGKAAAKEAGTEFVQENLEYAGETVGTNVDYELAEGLDRGAAGAVAGGGMGAGVRTVTAVAENLSTSDQNIESDAVTDSVLEGLAEPDVELDSEPALNPDPVEADHGATVSEQVDTESTQDEVGLSTPAPDPQQDIIAADRAEPTEKAVQTVLPEPSSDIDQGVLGEYLGESPVQAAAEDKAPATEQPLDNPSQSPEENTGDINKTTEIEESAKASIDLAANEAATSPSNDRPEPTEAQKEAGNYKKGKIRLHGLEISIENPAGSVRRGKDPDGNEWESPMHHHYGDLKRTTGGDGEPVDIFVGPNPESEKIFIVDQVNKDGSWDEHKTLAGFNSIEEATEGYKKNYEDGWTVGPVSELTVGEFKDWLKKGDTTKPYDQSLKVDKGGTETDSDIQQQGSLLFNKSALLKEGATPKGVPPKAAELYVKQFLKRYKGADDGLILRVHRTQEAWLGKSGASLGRVKGAYDTDENAVHLVASNLSDFRDVEHTLQHEILVHKGLGLFDKETEQRVVSAVLENAPKSKSLKPIWDEISRDYHDQPAKIQAEEVIAKLAERDLSKFDQFINKIMVAIQRALRKVGLAKDAVSRRDLVDLIYKVADAFKEGKKARQRTFDESLNSKEPVSTTDFPTDLRFSKSEQSANDKLAKALTPGSKGRTQAIKNWLRDTKSSNWGNALALINRRYLPDFAESHMTAAKDYVRLAQRMDADRSQLLSESSEIVDRWTKWHGKNKKQGRALANVMHLSTTVSYDPSKVYEPLINKGEALKKIAVLKEKARGRSGEGTGKFMREIDEVKMTLNREVKRSKAAPQIKALWDKLPADAKEIYVEVRDHYSLRRTQMFDTLMERIARGELSEEHKAKLSDMLRVQFEANTVEGPYFPLSRFGDYWAVAKDAEGQVFAFTLHEKLSEQESWLKEMEQQGFVVDSGRNTDAATTAKQVDPSFASKVTNLVSGLGGPTANKVADEIWQMFLHTLPEMSARKHFIHRKKTAGYSTDAIRSFAKSSFHSGHQLGKLRYSDLMEQELDNLSEQAKEAKRRDLAEVLHNEFVASHEWTMNPTSAQWANTATSIGFSYYLGLSPAAAAVNLLQTPMVAGPVLGAKHGFMKAAKELSKASGQLLGKGIEARLKGDELKAFKEFSRSGVIDKTRAHDLAGITETGGEYNPMRQKVMEVISYQFHKAESWNREVTAMAAYRLARSDGMSHEQAILHAEDMVWDSHFDYSNANRPRIMRGNVAKVALLFRQHSVNMTYRLWRDFHDMLKAEDPQLRTEAKKRFAGILGAAFMFAGLNGLALMSVINMVVSSLFDDEDDPFDFMTETRIHLYETLGQDLAELIMNGAADSATGWTISSRVSLNNLWMRDSNSRKEGGDAWLELLGEAAGPVAGIFQNMFEGVRRINDGHEQRGLETMMPKAIRDIMKTGRYLEEGALNFRGDEILSKDDLTAWEQLGQMLGFMPAQLALQYDQNSAIKNTERKLLDRRSYLINRYCLAVKAGDQSSIDSYLEEIESFNKANPEIGITGRVINRSLKTRMRYSDQSKNGINLNRKLWHLQEQLRFTD